MSETTPFTVNTADDFDGDGIPDAWEISQDLDPNSAADGNRYPTLTYRRRLDAAANGLTYTVQTSTNLNNWTANSLDIEFISTAPGGDGVTEQVTVRIKPPLMDQGVNNFVRVRVAK